MHRPSAPLSPRLAAVADRASLILIALLLAGFALRIWLSFAVRPAYAHSYDSLLFVDMARGELFSDPTRTVGYPILLRALHGISSDLDFTIQVQHLLGIATALVLYATVRRLGAPVWAGIAAAARCCCRWIKSSLSTY